MCGIAGAFNCKEHRNIVKKALETMNYRGRDNKSIVSGDKFSIGHLLHSIVGFVKQPIVDKTIFAANCEIYNYVELSKKHGIRCKNDAELLKGLIDKVGFARALDLIDGVYAIAYIKDNKLYLVRDLLGVKPIWFTEKPFTFASERKAIGFNSRELNPRTLIIYDIKKDRYRLIKRELKLEGNKEIFGALKDSILKRVPKGTKFGLLFTGGLNSMPIASILKEEGYDFYAYVAGTKNSKDVVQAKKAAKRIGLKLKVVEINEELVKNELPTICSTIESNNVTKVEIATPILFASKAAKRDGVKVLISGCGGSSVFGTYLRFKNATEVKSEINNSLLQLYERDLYREDTITMHNSIELRVPLLDKEFISSVIRIGQERAQKKIRERFGIKGKSVSPQYGSNSTKILKKLARPLTKSEYLFKIYPKKNLRLGVLYSGGKDSNLAAYIMKRMNYNLSCLITIVPKSNESYMFHPSREKLVKLQSRAMDIPLIIGRTEGKKEEELKDLKRTIKRARDKFNLDGVISGAVFSIYQRDRILKICEELGLKLFSPLWHVEQEKLLEELLKEGFKFIFTTVAAYGLDSSWLGKVVDKGMIRRLIELKNKVGINVAGEGGEYESLVVDSPLFKNKIKIKRSKIVSDNSGAYHLIIEDACLV